MEKDIIITESDEEILEYLDYKKNNIVLIEEEEEIIDYDPYDFLKDPAIYSDYRSVTYETFAYTLRFIRQLASLHNKKLTEDQELLFKTITYMTFHNGKCMPSFKNGIDFICPCKKLKEENLCPKKLFIDKDEV